MSTVASSNRVGSLRVPQVKALSIRQPWAWLILNGGQNVENRSWATSHRGRFLIHAASIMTHDGYSSAAQFARSQGIEVPPFEELARGGIIGSVELVDCVSCHESPWYRGEIGYVLQNPELLPFTPLQGAQRFFDVPAELLAPAVLRRAASSVIAELQAPGVLGA